MIMNAKNKLDRIEKSLDANDEKKHDFEVSWRSDGLIEWQAEDGSIELISPDEFKKRGGILLDWGDDLED